MVELKEKRKYKLNKTKQSKNRKENKRHYEKKTRTMNDPPTAVRTNNLKTPTN